MANFSEFYKGIESESVIEKLRNNFYESRSEYELALKNFILNKVNDCPCCFDVFYKKIVEKIQDSTFYIDLEPDELKVLEEMYFVKANDFQKPTNQ
jgi:hypothetical protein